LGQISSRISQLSEVISNPDSVPSPIRQELETIESIIVGLGKLKEEKHVSMGRLPEMNNRERKIMNLIISAIQKISVEWKELELFNRQA
jgi:hypothetical protein